MKAEFDAAAGRMQAKVTDQAAKLRSRANELGTGAQASLQRFASSNDISLQARELATRIRDAGGNAQAYLQAHPEQVTLATALGITGATVIAANHEAIGEGLHAAGDAVTGVAHHVGGRVQEGVQAVTGAVQDGVHAVADDVRQHPVRDLTLAGILGASLTVAATPGGREMAGEAFHTGTQLVAKGTAHVVRGASDAAAFAVERGGEGLQTLSQAAIDHPVVTGVTLAGALGATVVGIKYHEQIGDGLEAAGRSAMGVPGAIARSVDEHPLAWFAGLGLTSAAATLVASHPEEAQQLARLTADKGNDVRTAIESWAHATGADLKARYDQLVKKPAAAPTDVVTVETPN